MKSIKHRFVKMPRPCPQKAAREQNLIEAHPLRVPTTGPVVCPGKAGMVQSFRVRIPLAEAAPQWVVQVVTTVSCDKRAVPAAAKRALNGLIKRLIIEVTQY